VRQRRDRPRAAQPGQRLGRTLAGHRIRIPAQHRPDRLDVVRVAEVADQLGRRGAHEAVVVTQRVERQRAGIGHGQTHERMQRRGAYVAVRIVERRTDPIDVLGSRFALQLVDRKPALLGRRAAMHGDETQDQRNRRKALTTPPPAGA
jgi:hypothetical protein